MARREHDASTPASLNWVLLHMLLRPPVLMIPDPVLPRFDKSFARLFVWTCTMTTFRSQLLSISLLRMQ